ncbi:MAG: hypothetical protein R2867_42190 [Caldilineaceae bacterium]
MNDNRNYVTALAPTTQRRQPATIDATAVSTAPATIYVDAALQAQEGATEKTSGRDRSIALVIRMMPFTVVWLVLAIGVSWAASMGGGFTLVMFAGLTSVTYAYLDRQERQFSRNGIERHKIDTLADLKLAEMDHHQELRRMALEATLKQLEARQHDDY